MSPIRYLDQLEIRGRPKTCSIPQLYVKMGKSTYYIERKIIRESGAGMALPELDWPSARMEFILNDMPIPCWSLQSPTSFRVDVRIRG